MRQTPVPVTLGSPQFRTTSIAGCGIVQAWFPPESIIDHHIHEHATVAVMLNGSFDLGIRGRTYACIPASVAVEPAGERHANYIGSRGAEVVVLQPVPSETELWRPFASFLDSVGFLRHGGITAMATRLAQEIRTPDAFSNLAMEGLLLEILVAAARLKPETWRERTPPWLLRVQEILHEEPTAVLQIATLAREASVHPAHLARAFRRNFHCSIGEYSRRIRLQWAADRLATSAESIATIAAEAGFSDQSHLTRSFRRFFGTTPDCFRRVHRNGSGLPLRDSPLHREA
jgi:AraC family transcriptional regulator